MTESVSIVVGDHEMMVVPAIRTGDAAMFASFVVCYRRQAYAVARSIVTVHEDAEDVVQTAFLKAYTTLNHVAVEVPFAPWFFRVVVNTARDLVRRRVVRTTVSFSDAESIPLTNEAADPAENTELRSRLALALAELPERMRAIVILHTLDDYSHSELAKMFGIPAGTARSDLWHGRRCLRILLGDLWAPTLPPSTVS